MTRRMIVLVVVEVEERESVPATLDIETTAEAVPDTLRAIPRLAKCGAAPMPDKKAVEQ